MLFRVSLFLRNLITLGSGIIRRGKLPHRVFKGRWKQSICTRRVKLWEREGKRASPNRACPTQGQLPALDAHSHQLPPTPPAPTQGHRERHCGHKNYTCCRVPRVSPPSHPVLSGETHKLNIGLQSEAQLRDLRALLQASLLLRRDGLWFPVGEVSPGAFR